MSKYIKLEDAREKYITLLKDFETTWTKLLEYIDADEYDMSDLICDIGELANDFDSIPTIEASEDCISRAYIMDHIENQSREWGEEYDAYQILGDIEDAPSVLPIAKENGNEV